MTDVQFGSVEAIGTAASYTDATGGLMDYDGANYAQLTAKASGAGASIGWKLRALVAGVLTTLLTFTAGTANAVFAGNVSAQAVTATTAQTSGTVGIGTAPISNVGLFVDLAVAASTNAYAVLVEPTLTATANGDSLYGLRVLPTFTLGGHTSTTAYGVRIDDVTGAATNYALKTGAGLVAFGDAVTIASGLTVTAGGIVSSAGTNTFSGVIQPVGGIDCQLAAFKLVNVITTASATAGTNGAVPAQVLGYLELALGATTVKVPYFSV